jgi:hypothetical protein
MRWAERFSKEARLTTRRPRPSLRRRHPFDLFHYAFSISLELEVISTIRRPTLITDPASSSGPGSRSALDCPEQLMRFTAVEGADSHCEPKAPVLRNQRVLDWLDDTL